MLSAEMLKLLVCPVSRLPLTAAPPALIERINGAIVRKVVCNHAGRAVEKLLDGGLVTSDGQSVYPIMDRIPILLADERIPVSQLDSNGSGP